jgi:hypothetical protein
MTASLTGAGAITANMVGAGVLAAALAGSSSTSASQSALGHLTAALAGSTSISAAVTALGHVGAAINVTGASLTTANVGTAVWGQILESAGVDSYTASRILRIIAASSAGVNDGDENSFRNLSNSQTLIDGTVSGGLRTAVTYGS